MTATRRFDLLISERVVERTREFAHEKYSIGGDEGSVYVRLTVENAIREWCDEDDRAETEALLDTTLDALGGDDNEEKSRLFSDSLVATDVKTRFALTVHASVFERFEQDFAERAPTSDKKGDYLARILKQHYTDGRDARLHRKVKKATMYARCESGDASSVEQKVVAIRSELAEQFDNENPVSRDDLHDAVRTQPQTKSTKTVKRLAQKVLEHDTVEYVESPTTPDVFMPREQAVRNMEHLGLPDILDGPKYDRLQADYELSDLSKDDKIEGIKVALVRLAMDADMRGEYRLTAEQIRKRVFGIAESVRVDTIRRYMNEIIEEEGFTETQAEGTGAKAVQVSVPTIIKTDVDLLEKANLAKKYNYEDAPDTGLVVNISALFPDESDEYDTESNSVSGESHPSENSDDRQSIQREADTRFDELVEIT